MREIEKLANEKFNGDIPAAIDYAYRNWGSEPNEKMDKIFSEFTPEERRIACEVIRKLAIERSGEDVVLNFEKSIGYMKKLNMTDEEILSAESNPYGKKCTIFCILLLLAVALGIFFSDGIIISMILVAISINFVPDIIKYFVFIKARKHLKDSETKD